MIGWFDTREVDAFAAAIVAEVAARFPPEKLDLPDKKALDRIKRMSESISGRVRDFASGKRLNFYKRARLGNQVKWAMKEAGYSDAFTDAFTYELVTLVSVVR
jgi:hypothetical protein